MSVAQLFHVKISFINSANNLAFCFLKVNPGVEQITAALSRARTIKNCVFLKSFWLIVFLPLCLYWKLDFHENSLGHLDNLKLVGDYWESKLEIQVSQILQLTDNLCSLSWGTWLGIGVSLHASAYSAYLRNHVKRRRITEQLLNFLNSFCWRLEPRICPI